MKREDAMSDEQIRKILIERKRQERRKQNREAILEIVEGVVGWSSLFFIGFMLSVIGG